MSNIFENYLNCENAEHKQIALTTSSHKNVEHNLKDQDVNNELATYGDALLKLALCKILFKEKVANITVKKQKYESDKILVTVVAKKYNLLEYMRFDRNDPNIPKDYEYKKPPKGQDVKHKYIATTVEALLAAIYLDNKEDFTLIVDIVREWKQMIDESNVKVEK